MHHPFTPQQAYFAAVESRNAFENPFDRSSDSILPEQQDESGWDHYNALASHYAYPSPPQDQNEDFSMETQSELESTGCSTNYASPLPTGDSDDEGMPEEAMVSISTSFSPTSHSSEADLVFSSSDQVMFYAHPRVITNACHGAFAGFLPTPVSLAKNTLLYLPDTSVTINIIMHALYGSSCAVNSPTLDDLIAAVDRMPFYGIEPTVIIRPQSQLHQLLLSHAPLRPIDVYSLAAFHDLRTLAETTSSHLLAFPLSDLDDASVTRMGPLYIRRLFMLHLNRLSALKEILLRPPALHNPTKMCRFEEQRKVTRAWALAAAHIIWEARPDFSTFMIKSSFNTVFKDMACTHCKSTTDDRIRDAVVQWASIKCTI